MSNYLSKLNWFARRRFRKGFGTSETAELGGSRFRVTKRKGEILAIEKWTYVEVDCGGYYDYTIWKGALT